MQTKTDKLVDDIESTILNLIESESSGQLYEMAKYHFSVLGKMVRPRLIKGLAEACHIPLQKVIPWATCCEIFHNATLIHDDIQDGDEYRRGQISVWNKYGVAQAINLGDFLFLLAPQVLSSSFLSSKESFDLVTIYSRMSCQIVRGQCAETQLNQLESLDKLEDLYNDCVLGKTSALFAGMAQGVCSLQENHSFDQSAIIDIFERIGRVFQWQDDLLDLWGDKQRGEVGCDIKEGKVSFPIVQHLKHFPQDFDIIRDLLHKDRDFTSADDVLLIKKRLENKGTLDSSLQALISEVENILCQAKKMDDLKFLRFVHQVMREILVPIGHLVPEFLPGEADVGA